MAKGYISNRQKNLSLGIVSYTENQEVLSVIGKVGIGTRIDITPYDTLSDGTLSFEGSAGQLFSITNNLTTGSIFSVNDVSGIPSIDVDADGTIQLAPFGASEYVGVGKTNPTAKLDVSGDALFDGYVAIGTNTPFLGDSKVTIDVGVGTDDIGLSVVSGFTATYDGFQSGGVETTYRGLNISNNVASDYNTAVLQLNAINSSGFNNPWYLGAISTPEAGRGGQFFIGHRDNAAPNGRAEVLRIGTDGDVGIGTTNPTAKLDVNGTAKATLFVGSGASLTNIPNGALDNSTVSYGGVQLSLGGSDATPAFDLSDATNYPYTSLTGITTDIVGDTTPQLGGDLDLNGNDITGTGDVNITGIITATTFSGSGASLNSIPNAALDNSTVSYGGITLSLGDSDATPAFDLSDATNYPYSSLTGITTDIVGDTTPQLGGNLDLNGNDITGTGDVNITGIITATTFSGSGASLNSIPNGALDNSTVSYGGIQLSLGGSDATPAFDLSDATNYPYTSLTGITTDIVGDTSPQLGGNLDLNSNDITGTGNISITGNLNVSGVSTFQDNVNLGDNDRLRLGDSQDLQIWHSGSNSIIQDNGTGNLFLQGSNSVRITDLSSNEMAVFVDGGAVELYNNADKKFETTGYGVTVSGGLNVSGVSTFQDNVDLGDNDRLRFGAGQDLQIYHTGSNSIIQDTGDGDLFLSGDDVVRITNSSFTETKALFTTNGSVELYYDNSLKFETTTTGIEVSNGASTSATIAGPDEIIIDPATVGDNTGSVRIKGDLYVDGTTTQINSTSIELADFIVGIATTATTDSLADGAGIQIGPDNTFLYEYNSGTNPSLKSSENLNVASGKHYQIGETEVLNATTLGSGVTNSSLTSLGTIATGVWQGTAINDTYIGTIDNANKVSLSALNIDGGTATTTLEDADLLIVDDGANGTNRKITASNAKNYFLNGTASNATNVTVADESTDTTCFPLFVTGATGNLPPKSGSNLTFNSNTGVLGATSFSGNGASLTNVDAVTLDGLDSTQFLRSDAADIKTSGNLTFNDNIEARFGDSADLLVYHNGSNSFVEQVGTGNLVLKNDTDDADVVIRTDNGSGGTAIYFLAEGSTGEAILHHYGSEKLATKSTGIDVTGLTDTDTLNVSGVSTFVGDVSIADKIIHTGDTNTAIRFPANDTFTVETSGSERVRVTSNGSVGIGTDNPAFPLTVSGANATVCRLENTSSTTAFLTLEANNTTQPPGMGASANDLVFNTSFTEQVRIKSSGLVGIGTNNPSQTLDVNGNARFRSAIYDNNNVVGTANSVLTSTGSGVVWAPSGANVSVGTEAPTSPFQGQLWYNSEIGRTFVYYQDGTSNQWVDSAPFYQNEEEPILTAGKTSNSFTATEGQTTFTFSYEVGYIEVYLNGVRLSVGEYTATNGTSFTLSTGASEGDIVDVVEYIVGIGATGSGGPIENIAEKLDSATYYPIFTTGVGSTLPYITTTSDYFEFTPSTGTLDVNNLTTGNSIVVGSAVTITSSAINITGGITASGIITATDFNSTSDIALKTNITQIDNPIDKISQINGVSFDWKETQRPSAGVIAQDVEKVLPQLVNGEDTKTVNYNGLIGVLIEAVKEQQEQINTLKEEIAKLKG